MEPGGRKPRQLLDVRRRAVQHEDERDDVDDEDGRDVRPHPQRQDEAHGQQANGQEGRRRNDGYQTAVIDLADVGGLEDGNPHDE